MEINEVHENTSLPAKEQGYSVRETELIRELVKARLERKAELEHENLEGYELPPRSQFSMLKKPALTIKYGRLKFNMACIHLFEGVQYILPIINRSKKRIAVVTCTEEESASVQWARQKEGVWINKEIPSVEVVEKIFAFMGWDRLCRYKALGRVATSDSGLILVFDLSEAIMFGAKPVEYEDPETGEIKMRQMKFYPDEYKNCIGKSYNDYAAGRQLNLFEDLTGYTGESDTERSGYEGNPHPAQENA